MNGRKLYQYALEREGFVEPLHAYELINTNAHELKQEKIIEPTPTIVLPEEKGNPATNEGTAKSEHKPNKGEKSSKKTEIQQEEETLKGTKELEIPEKYFENQKFHVQLLIQDILEQYKIIYIDKIGFYIYRNYWQKVSKEAIEHIFYLQLDNLSRPKYLNEASQLLKVKTFRTLEKTPQNRNRLVLLNGTLDFSDWNNLIFYENQFFPDDYCMIQLNCNYNPTAECPTFENFLQSTFEGDKEIIALVGEMFGYCLTTATGFEKAFLLYGEGSNGKSVLLDVLQNLLTLQNICSVSMSDLHKPFSRSSLKDKLVNISTELETEVMDTGYFKKIISGDIIDAQFKFKDSFEFQPFCKLIFAMNKLPIVRDRSGGFYRRLILIPFDRVFTEREQDKELKVKLSKELDGILQFALKGLKRLAENKEFTYSQKCNRLLNQYKLDSNPVEQFFVECIAQDENSSIATLDLYKHYRQYCLENGLNPINNSNFGKEVTKKYGDIKIRSSTGNRPYIYKGLKLL